MKTSALVAAVAGASAAMAHTIMVQLEAGGVRNPVSYGIRTPVYDGPITDVTSNDVACNGGPNPTTPSDKIIEVQAGSSVTAVWRHTLTSGPGDVMDASHKGPTLAYLRKVDNALTDTGIGGGWIKIQEEGYNSGNWATSKVITNGGLHVIDIPKCIPDGQYLLRAEMIALHGASGTGGAQLYMECAQIKITGGSGTFPSSTYSIPGIYKATDPGILVNIYSMTPSSQYVIPGPPKFTCGGGSGSGGNGGGSSSGGNGGGSSSGGSTPTTLVTSAKPTSTTPATGGCVAAQWAQCGGIGFTGCTTCASGSTCKKSGDYYSQCV